MGLHTYLLLKKLNSVMMLALNIVSIDFNAIIEINVIKSIVLVISSCVKRHFTSEKKERKTLLTCRQPKIVLSHQFAVTMNKHKLNNSQFKS